MQNFNLRGEGNFRAPHHKKKQSADSELGVEIKPDSGENVELL